MQPQFLPARRAGGVDVGKEGAGLRPHPAGADLQHLVEAGKIQHQPAGQRHGLPVIAGAGPARCDGYAKFKAGGEDVQHLLLAHRCGEDVADHPVELALQCRRVPVEVAALLPQHGGIVLQPDAREPDFEGGEVKGHAGAP